MNSDEKVVVSAREWHKSCHEKTRTQKVYVHKKIDNTETCPGCNKSILSDQEKIVSIGKEWHSNCFKNKRN